MITRLLNLTILIIGATLVINGVTVKAEDILANARSAANYANIHQFKTALELYYTDHGNYPEVSGGAALINALKSENYIRENLPPDPNNFNYQVKDNGQDYSLDIN